MLTMTEENPVWAEKHSLNSQKSNCLKYELLEFHEAEKWKIPVVH